MRRFVGQEMRGRKTCTHLNELYRTFADIGALIQFRGKQIGAQVISVFQVYEVAPMLILSLKRSNITKPSDLAGKQLASRTLTGPSPARSCERSQPRSESTTPAPVTIRNRSWSSLVTVTSATMPPRRFSICV